MNITLDLMVEVLRRAREGDSVMVVGPDNQTVSTSVGNGALFIRNSEQQCGLKSVAVNVVYFIGHVSKDVRFLIMERTRGFVNPTIFNID